ncbi:MAG TPA: YtxH domain-containing protein [Chitinophagaceae bacterium]|nr:YtxH domain-containing protein [Chitinophagaceae bacterium]
MTTGTKVFLGILGAATAGVVIGLLIAPEKGSETRKKIAKTTGDWADQISNVFRNTQDQYNDLKEKAKHMKSAAEHKVSNLKEDLG